MLFWGAGVAVLFTGSLLIWPLLDYPSPARELPYTVVFLGRFD